MHYPIFTSIVNTVKTQLGKRGIQSNTFKTWEDNKIHAIGLEMSIDLSETSNFIESLAINFDWDSFREISVARRMDGLEKHPLLNIEKLVKINVTPTIDVEMSWVFDIEASQPQQTDREGNYRIEQASKWMESISKQINETQKNENIITRWHIEIEGDEQGKYLSSINLISYFQYELNAPKNLNQLQSYVSKKLQGLLMKGFRVISFCDNILTKAVAA